jgi:hypothetical protein
VNSVWGKFEPSGRQGGVCFSTLSDRPQATYADLLGYRTGTEASIQLLIYKDYFWRSKMPYHDWPDFLRQAAENLFAPRTGTAPHITVSKLTTTTIGSATSGAETGSPLSACETPRKPHASKSEKA